MIVLSACAALLLGLLLLLVRGIEDWVAVKPDPVRAIHPHCARPAEWITAEDYPADAIRNEQEGTVRIQWTIGDDGRVDSCKILESSGVPSLDKASCDAIIARGCYNPRTLTAERSDTRRVVWRLPEF